MFGKLFGELLKNFVGTALKGVLAKLLEDFVKKLSEEQGAPAGAAHLTGPEVQRAIDRTVDEWA